MRKLPVATLALAALLALSGCVPEQPPATSTPVPSSTPVFASEEDALAAAEAAYAEYLRVSDEIAHDGGTNPERIEPLVTAEWLPKETDAFGRLSASGNHQEGSSAYRNLSLQQVTESGDGLVEVVVYLCSDSSGTRFIDPSGADITPPDRQTLNSIQATFEGNSTGLLLSNYEPWSGESFC